MRIGEVEHFSLLNIRTAAGHVVFNLPNEIYLESVSCHATCSIEPGPDLGGDNVVYAVREDGLRAFIAGGDGHAAFILDFCPCTITRLQLRDPHVEDQFFGGGYLRTELYRLDNDFLLVFYETGLLLLGSDLRPLWHTKSFLLQHVFDGVRDGVLRLYIPEENKRLDPKGFSMLDGSARTAIERN